MIDKTQHSKFILSGQYWVPNKWHHNKVSRTNVFNVSWRVTNCTEQIQLLTASAVADFVAKHAIFAFFSVCNLRKLVCSLSKSCIQANNAEFCTRSNNNHMFSGTMRQFSGHFLQLSTSQLLYGRFFLQAYSDHKHNPCLWPPHL